LNNRLLLGALGDQVRAQENSITSCGTRTTWACQPTQFASEQASNTKILFHLARSKAMVSYALQVMQIRLHHIKMSTMR